jgi:hypothetical protein
MLKEALYSFVYEHTAGSVFQACSWQLVSASQGGGRAANQTGNCLSLLYYLSYCLETNQPRAMDFYKNLYWNLLSDSVYLPCVNFFILNISTSFQQTSLNFHKYLFYIN